MNYPDELKIKMDHAAYQAAMKAARETTNPDAKHNQFQTILRYAEKSKHEGIGGA